MRALSGPPCPRCGLRMSFSVQIPNAGRQQKDLAFYRCGSCKRMATEVRTRAAASSEREQVGFDHEFNR